jgi:LAGLIDADG DNA endonuclease family
MQVKKYLTRAERSLFILSPDLKEILIGLILGDLYINKQKTGINARLEFTQGVVHIEYLQHLFELFNYFCGMVPKIPTRSPDKRTGKIYDSAIFYTYSLPCFLEFYNLFYPDGKKIIPLNIGDLLTPLGLAYWVADDGSFCSTNQVVVLSTECFTLEEINLLIKVLSENFNLKATINKNGAGFRIRISKESIPVLQALLAPHMPSMMRYKIGL